MANSTEVSKSNPTIKKILAATVGPAWRGRRVTIVEAPYGWEHTQYIDDQMHGWYLNLATLPAIRPYARQTPRPTYGGPNLVHKRPEGDDVFVIRERFLGKDLGVEIVIPDHVIDHSSALSVATDALLEKNKKSAVATLARFGVFAGVAMAIAEAHAKTLTKGERAGDVTGAIVSTSQSASTKRAKKSAARLEREISAVLGRRV
jgi:hypothetical protein